MVLFVCIGNRLTHFLCSQVHDTFIIRAINELQDNAVEANAKKQWIELDECKRVLCFRDDGCGLNRSTWSRLVSFGKIRVTCACIRAVRSLLHLLSRR